MDDVILALKLLLLFVSVGIISCTLLSWHWWSSMWNSKWIDERKKEDKDDGDGRSVEETHN